MNQQPLENLRQARIEKLEKIKALGIDPYPAETPAREAVKTVRNRTEGPASAAGRLLGIRGHGKLIFADLKDESGQIQLCFKADILDDKKFELVKFLDIGDFIWVSGDLFTTAAGELTIQDHDLKLLSKSLRPLPSEYYGLKDEEERFRQRYVDFILNPELHELFVKKFKFWQATRNFLLSKGFLEVETPVLEATAGGADAEPFVTHHNALDIDLFLRISMGELWQKRLMVAGFEKTFEIGRQFRNEGMSREHLQDYTQMEFYWAYASYKDSMALVEELYKHIAKEAFGTLQFEIGNHTVDFDKKWETIDYVQTIIKRFNIDVLVASNEELLAKLKEVGVYPEIHNSRPRLIDLLWKQVRREIPGPVFLTGHPVETCPLAKRDSNNPRKVQEYQIILGGSEMGKGYSELNDPIDQAARFDEQQKLRESGDTEAQMFDQDFVRALEYGMPPVTGFGVSERLFAFLANKPVREAVMFPLLRPETTVKTGKQDLNQKMVVVIDSQLPTWQVLNTSGHVAAFLGNKMKSGFDTGDYFVTKNGTNLPRNSQYPVITLSATKEQLQELINEVRQSGLLYIGYVPEMMQTSDDRKLEKLLSLKSDDSLSYTGIGVFGPISEVDKLTKKFKLWE